MTITKLHHVNIVTEDIPKSAAFFADVFQLEARNAGDNYPPEMVQWMYNADGQPVIHLFCHPDHRREAGATGVIHHVAMDCVDHVRIAGRLDHWGAKYRTRQDPGGAIIFMQDLHGVMFELYFPGESLE